MYQQYAINQYTEMVKAGALPQKAAMDVLQAARATGDERIMDAVLAATSRFPEAIDTAQ